MTNTTPLLRALLALLALLSVLSVLLAMAGCRADLPLDASSSRPPRDFDEADEDEPALHVTIEPEAPLNAAPRVLRLRVAMREDMTEERIVLARGKLQSNQLGQIARDEISKSLQERLVPHLRWRDADGSLVLAPSVPLAPGEVYAVASGDLRVALPLTVASKDEARFLPRVWPPEGSAGTSLLGVFCDDRVAVGAPVELPLSPSGQSGALLPGLVDDDGPGANCLRFQVEAPTSQPLQTQPEPSVLPPLARLGGRSAAPLALDPRPFVVDEGPLLPASPLPCVEEETAFGLGCARLWDDRLLVRVPEAPLLWAIRAGDAELVQATRGKETLLLKGLSPDTSVALDVVTVDAFGVFARSRFTAKTRPPMPHVVLNEVMANPLGPEPHQEWVELYNDGLVDAALGGYVIADIGGKTELPEATLGPGQYALVVPESFDLEAEVDVPPAPDVLLLRVPALGKQGLSNSGEPLRLFDAREHVLSRFPALPKPEAGQSVARIAPSAPDGVKSSFVAAAPTPGF